MTVSLAYIAYSSVGNVRGKCPGGVVRIPNHTYPKRLYGRANKIAGPTIHVEAHD